MKGEDRADKIAVVVGTVTNDLRIFKIPKLKVSSVQFLVTNMKLSTQDVTIICSSVMSTSVWLKPK